MNDAALTMILGFALPCIMTTLGALLIFFFVKESKIINVLTIGLASGIMLSASIWSLLMPAIDHAKADWGELSIIPVVLGFVLGCLFMLVLDFLCSKIFKSNEENGRRKAYKLFMAITIHNIPEGLSVGFAIGTAIATNSTFVMAIMFALGIALQNFPEGLATALPIHNALHSKTKAFSLGFLSGIVEPIFAVIGFFLASTLTSLLPWLLSFSAGAMIYVIVEELMPELTLGERKHLGTWAFVIGFLIMMILDLCL